MLSLNGIIVPQKNIQKETAIKQQIVLSFNIILLQRILEDDKIIGYKIKKQYSLLENKSSNLK